MTVRLPKKILALLLSVCLILPTLSAAASAAETDTWRTEITGMTGDTAQTTITEEAALSETVFQLDADCRILSYVDEAVFREADHIARLNEEETLSTYVFLNRDGTKTVYYMDEEVKYLDSDGTVREKDLSLTADLNGYTTAQNDISLTLPENLSEGVGLSYAGYDISLIPQITTARVTGPQVNGNAVGYQNCFGNGTVLVYTPTLSGLKEDIMLVAYTGVSSFEFLLNTDGLGLYQEDGRYYLSASPTAELRIRLGDIVAFDATGSFSVGSMTVTTVAEQQQYRLTVSVDPAFLADPNTVYPVSIDPSITVSDNTHGAGAIEDASIYQGAPTLNAGSWQYAHCGYVDSTYKVGRILIRPKKLLSDSTYQSVSASQIESAYFYIWETSGTSAQTINLYSLSGSTSWTESGVTWNNAGVTQGTKYASASPGSNAKASFNITNLVKAWKNNQATANCGFMLTSSNETSVDKAFCTSEYETTSTRPYVVVEYQIGSGESFETAERVYFDSNITVSIDQSNKKRYLKFIPTTSSEYLFYSSNASGDPKMWLYDSAYNLLDSNDNNGGSSNFRLVEYLSSGNTYYLELGHYGTKTGSYVLHMLQDAKVSNGTYNLKNVSTEYYLDIHGPVAQEVLHQWEFHAGEQIRWKFTRDSNGYYTMQSLYGDKKYAAVSNTSIGTENIVLVSSVTDFARWKIFKDSSGYLYFEPKSVYSGTLCAPNYSMGTELQLAYISNNNGMNKWTVRSDENPHTHFFEPVNLKQTEHPHKITYHCECGATNEVYPLRVLCETCRAYEKVATHTVHEVKVFVGLERDNGVMAPGIYNVDCYVEYENYYSYPFSMQYNYPPFASFQSSVKAYAVPPPDSPVISVTVRRTVEYCTSSGNVIAAQAMEWHQSSANAFPDTLDPSVAYTLITIPAYAVSEAQFSMAGVAQSAMVENITYFEDD